MAKKTINMESMESYLISKKISDYNKLHNPVTHESIINAIRRELEDRSFIIKDVSFNISNDGDRVVGMFHFKTSKEDKITKIIGFRNSYDKTMAFGIFTGISELKTNNHLFGHIVSSRKHIEETDLSISEKIKYQIDLSIKDQNQLMEFKTSLKEIKLYSPVPSQILGGLIFEEKILLSTQINLIKLIQKKVTQIKLGKLKEKGLDGKKLEGEKKKLESLDINAWVLYTQISEALKLSNPIVFYKNHITLYNLFQENLLGQ